MAITQLSPQGMPGRRYGSFAGKTASSELTLGGIHLRLNIRQRLDLTADMRQSLTLTANIRQQLGFDDVHLGGDDN